MSNFSIVVENHTGYVQVFIKGKRNYIQAVDSISEAFESIKINGSKLLFRDQAESCFSVSEVFNLILEMLKSASEIEGLDENPGIQIAYYNESEEATDMVSFAETVAMNRGLHFKGFTDEQEALNWLGINQ